MANNRSPVTDSSEDSSDDEFFDAKSEAGERASLASRLDLTHLTDSSQPVRPNADEDAEEDEVDSGEPNKSSPSDPDVSSEITGDSDRSPSNEIDLAKDATLASPLPLNDTLSNKEQNTSIVITPSDETIFVQPRAPPRRKKRNNTIEAGATSAESNTLSAEFGSVSSELGDRQSRLRESLRTNFSSLIDDIASIQGDLSVTDAFVAQGERKSVYADDTRRKDQLLSDDLIEKVVQENLNEMPQTSINDEVTLKNVSPSSKDDLSTSAAKEDEHDEQLRLVSNCLNPISFHLMKLNHEFDSELEEEELEAEEIARALKDATATPTTMQPVDPITLKNTLPADDVSTIEREGTAEPNCGSSRKQLLKNRVRNLRKLGSDLRKRFGRSEPPSVLEHSPTGGTSPAGPILPGFWDAEAQAQIKFKSNRKKDSADFSGLRLIQELNDCRGAIWCMRWSTCGRLLAVAGQDQLLRVYCSFTAWKHFTQLRSNASGGVGTGGSGGSGGSLERSASLDTSASSREDRESECMLSEEGPLLLFSAYRGHTADVLDIAWSKNHFLLSSSMDKTVLLWHVSRVECLCIFRHIDFVTTIQFHPRDDRYFLSGSLDGKVRLWNIPDKRVTLWNEVTALPSPSGRSATASNANASNTAGASGSGGGSGSLVPSHGLITASAFVQNGKFAVIGTYDGRVIFYTTDQLKYFTQLHVSAQKQLSGRFDLHGSSADRRKRKHNYKITGIEPVDETKILVTTNDSRIRLYDLRDLSLTCKYKGHTNVSSQIKASISHDNRYIVCGSENSSFYIWRLQQDTSAIAQRRDRNSQWESVRLLPTTSSTISASNMNSAYTSMMGSVAGPAGSTTSGSSFVTGSTSSGTTGHNLTGTTSFSTNTMSANASTGTSKSNAPGIVTCATFASAPTLLDAKAKYVIAVADFSGTIKLFAK